MPVWSEDDYALGTQEEWAFKSRTVPAQIVDIDHRAGTLTVVTVGSRERYTVDIPVQGFAIKGVFSSWQRYMPVRFEFVDLTFTAGNRPRVMGISTYPGPKDHGVYDIARAQLGSTFRQLESGEFDLRSAGAAGYYFTRTGQAILEAGAMSIRLDSPRLECVGEAGLWVQQGGGCVVRHGDVKRVLPSTFRESGVVPNPSSAVAPKEWKRVLSYLTPPLGEPQLYLEQCEIGDIRDDVGAPVLGSFNNLPLRARQRFYDPTGLVTTLTTAVDVAGNTKVTFGATATVGGLNLSGPTAPLSASFLSVDLTASATMNVTGKTVSLNAGGTADSPILRSAELLLYLANPAKFAVLTAFGPALVVPTPFTAGVEVSLAAKVK